MAGSLSPKWRGPQGSHEGDTGAVNHGKHDIHLGKNMLIFDDVLVGREQDIKLPTSKLRYKCPSCCWRALGKEEWEKKIKAM